MWFIAGAVGSVVAFVNASKEFAITFVSGCCLIRLRLITSFRSAGYLFSRSITLSIVSCSFTI